MNRSSQTAVLDRPTQPDPPTTILDTPRSESGARRASRRAALGSSRATAPTEGTRGPTGRSRAARIAPTAAPALAPVSRRAKLAEAALLAVTALLYFWNLTNSGYGNTFYAAAVRAGSENWVSLLFGSLDANNGITVDKPPASLWIPSLLGQVFGFSSWTVLAPQAAMGVAAVWILSRAVRRTNGPVAGILAGAALAATPVATMMFRFNNPDALLTLLLTAAAYAVIRATSTASRRWLYVAGLVLGFAFLTKMLQGFLTIPPLALGYLWAAPVSLRRRVTDLWAAVVGLITAPAVYLTIFQLTPTSVRPYMAGSENNSFWELTLGYNGLGRIFGGSGNGGGNGGGGGGGGAMGANTGFGGSTGLGRMFNAAFGTEISWLLPGALLLLVAGLWFTRRQPRTDSTRSALVIWGGWLVVTALVFSFMEGTIHPYYAVALAPAIAAIVGIGAWELYRGRDAFLARWALALFVLVTSTWSFVLLHQDASWLPWLKWLVLAAGMVSAAGLALGLDRPQAEGTVRRGMAALLLVTGLIGLFGGTAAYSAVTATVGHHGSIPTSGPSASASDAGPGGGQSTAGAAGAGAQGSAGTGAAAPTQGGATTGPQGSTGTATSGAGSTSSSALHQALAATHTKYSAATVGATTASDLMIGSDTEVLDIGGWMGSDPYPTLAQFQAMVKNGDITYFIVGQGGGAGGPGGGNDGTGQASSSSAITAWVTANYTATTVGGQTVYKLT
ncbi:glycosyltransferase family 39 protein [Falsarthrobacter nasiphocae]|uniref:4-amino-4-deoxy-L-arabinose transferase-like glycosyltransferase n=1 Tax=Falsarthrobacter nasiphocae TaxID=189863 RepID=A0AAE3YGC0_9MICC|nr:glycosyltransferase family 39 protein [Falsarthrobacter nasiphocae]MDR6892919.1 4-amino-4-deoxy-L-arabinose transferase-like glycosyltransferase [Falsarthrobacter nasiphocae]